MADEVNAVVGAITNGVRWVRQKYREFKVWVAEQLIKALEKGWSAALTIAGIVTASIVVGYVWDIMKRNAVVMAVKNFITTVSDYAKRLAAILQLDLILAVVNLGILVNEKLYEALSPLYEELGNFAEELELDVSYISTFIEVDRAILQASYSLTNMGWLQASAQFATGLRDWLGRLRGRLAEYAADPRRIFVDIQNEIAAERVKAADEQLGKIWAAINAAGEWIQAKGEVALKLVSDIDAQVKRMPSDVQEAIKPWYNDAVKKVDEFRTTVWGPFWTDYERFTDTVDDMFLVYGTDIAELKRRIDDPIDWLRSLLALPYKEQSTLRDTIAEVFGLPKSDEVRADQEVIIPAMMAAIDEIDANWKRSIEPPTIAEGLPIGELTAETVDTSSSGPALTDAPELV